MQRKLLILNSDLKNFKCVQFGLAYICVFSVIKTLTTLVIKLIPLFINCRRLQKINLLLQGELPVFQFCWSSLFESLIYYTQQKTEVFGISFFITLLLILGNTPINLCNRVILYILILVCYVLNNVPIKLINQLNFKNYIRP